MENFMSVALGGIAGILVVYVFIRLFLWFMKSEIRDMVELVRGYRLAINNLNKMRNLYEAKNEELKRKFEEYQQIVDKFYDLRDTVEENSRNQEE